LCPYRVRLRGQPTSRVGQSSDSLKLRARVLRGSGLLYKLRLGSTATARGRHSAPENARDRTGGGERGKTSHRGVPWCAASQHTNSTLVVKGRSQSRGSKGEARYGTRFAPPSAERSKAGGRSQSRNIDCPVRSPNYTVEGGLVSLLQMTRATGYNAQLVCENCGNITELRPRQAPVPGRVALRQKRRATGPEVLRGSGFFSYGCSG